MMPAADLAIYCRWCVLVVVPLMVVVMMLAVVSVIMMLLLLVVEKKTLNFVLVVGGEVEGKVLDLHLYLGHGK